MASDFAPTAVRLLLARQSDIASATDSSSDSTGDKFLKLIASPFSSQFALKAVLASLAWSIPLTILIALSFCFLRPYNSVVYAPRAKHADRKHAPPVVPKGLFGWILPLIRTKEPDLVEKVGLDAAVFMRFCRMMRNIFTVLSVVGCAVLIPINVTSAWGSAPTDPGSYLMRATPQYMIPGTPMLWAYVVVAYVFTFVVFFFLWTNYKAVFRLRRAYFDSSEYQRSLHARTLLLTDVPKELRTDDGIVRLTEQIRSTDDIPRAAIARNVRDLPDLVEEHEETVRRLEKHLARYLKNPDKLPAKRPTCKVNTKDKTYKKGQQVDAIDYLTARIKELEIEVKQAREAVDKRNALSYGFASYDSIAEAHSVAYAARKKGPHDTMIRLAPRPTDLVWKNLALSKKARARNNFINNLWVALLTIVWVGPNIMIAVFLSNLTNIGGLWPAFQDSLEKYPKSWALVQGIGAPLLTTLFYLYLPAIFRRLCVSGGDLAKTTRERHVTHKLYSFFVFNNLIVFSLFSALFTFISTIVADSSSSNFFEKARDAQPFKNIVRALCAVSPYWISWLLQRNLGAALDLSQLVTLLWRGFLRRFSSPTPREMIELTAPQPFDYAGYYNYFLFYATIAICFGPFQPVVLPVAALYFWLDGFLKKYLILYVFITKYESGGMFWRTLYNRTLFLSVLGNILIALLVVANSGYTSVNWAMLACLAPLLFITAGFKWYCVRTFDDPIHWYQTGKMMRDAERAVGTDKKSRRDRVGVRFGHPVLYQPLITPMVSSKSQHLLKSLYTGRISHEDGASTTDYSDVYMDAMDSNQPGKSRGTAPFEFVDEHNMDFEHYKNRPEFRNEAGGDGQLFGHSQDITRPGTPGSRMTRAGTMESFDSHQRDSYYRSRSHSRDSERTKVNEDGAGVEYPRGYHQTPANLREHSPARSDYSEHFSRPHTRHGSSNLREQGSRTNLVSNAAVMGHAPPIQGTPMGGYGPLGRTPGIETPGYESGEETSYDYFRRGRNV